MDKTKKENLNQEKEESADYFTEGFDPEDIPGLYNLKQKLPMLDGFAVLFRGEPKGMSVRIHVLSEMTQKLDNSTTWGVTELRQYFSYLTENSFEGVLKRFREGGLISYDRERSSYSVTPLGFQISSSLSYFLRNYEEEGLGLLTGLIFADDAMGGVSKEELSHLLNRLGQLEKELLSAVDTASEQIIWQARKRFEAVWKRISQGTDIIRKIAKNENMDRETHKLGQRIAEAQSRLARVTSVFQRAINDIDRQRLHIGSSGISTSDLNAFLISQTSDELVSFLAHSISVPVQPTLLLSDLLADVAEYELFDREREEKEVFALPAPVASEEEIVHEEKEITHLTDLISDMKELSLDPLPLREFIPAENYELASYRLSMLSLTGNAQGYSGPMEEMIKLPVEFLIEHGSEEVMENGVKEISKGHIKLKHGEGKESC